MCLILSNTMSKVILNTTYFPPVQYLACVNRYDEVGIEQWESYGKQSYRNRCEILSANGILSLTVPVKKTNEVKFLTKEACIDYSTRWQKLHFKGIESAYKNSPYYDYYVEDFIPFFEKKEKYLLDLNTAILETVLGILQIRRSLVFTTDYQTYPEEVCDMRGVIHPKPARQEKEDNLFKAKPYTQTFADRFPFAPDLSILDLLFNTGPEAVDYL